MSEITWVEDVKMGGKTGRPRIGEDAKKVRLTVRVSPHDAEKLLEAARADTLVPGEEPPEWFRRKLLEAAETVIRPGASAKRGITTPLQVRLAPDLRAAVEEYCRAMGQTADSFVAGLVSQQLTEMHHRLRQMGDVLRWREVASEAPANETRR